MKIKDIIYGSEEINEPILEELIKSPSLQRLKNISQFGMPKEYYHIKSFSRYNHSLGVFILLKKLNAGLEEQVAGLLHDVSHSAFSHVFDWVVGNPEKEDYQDKELLNFIKNSEISGILKKHSFNYKKIADLERFSLLEKEIPDLCVDRIDYSLRELAVNGENAYNLFLDLGVKNNEIFFNSRKKAEIFAQSFLKLQKEHWGGAEARARYYILSEILKQGLKDKIISLDEIKTGEDWPILNKLEKYGNKKIKKQLNLLKNGFSLKENLKGIILKKKFRYVNPKVLQNNELVYLSDISKDYKKILKKEKNNSLEPKRVLIST